MSFKRLLSLPQISRWTAGGHPTCVSTSKTGCAGDAEVCRRPERSGERRYGGCFSSEPWASRPWTRAVAHRLVLGTSRDPGSWDAHANWPGNNVLSGVIFNIHPIFTFSFLIGVILKQTVNIVSNCCTSAPS